MWPCFIVAYVVTNYLIFIGAVGLLGVPPNMNTQQHTVFMIVLSIAYLTIGYWFVSVMADLFGV